MTVAMNGTSMCFKAWIVVLDASFRAKMGEITSSFGPHYKAIKFFNINWLKLICIRTITNISGKGHCITINLSTGL